jgi:putative lipoprotein
MASRDGKPTSIDRAGWSDDGTRVLKQHQVGSDVQVLDAAEADKMKQEAMTILGLATHGKNK